MGNARSRSGDRGSITIVFNGIDHRITVGDTSIHKFSMDMQLDGFPAGKASIVVGSDMVDGLRTDTPGIVMFSGMDDSDSSVVYIIHVMSTARTTLSKNMVQVDIGFVFGAKSLYANMPATAAEGSSVFMMCRAIEKLGIGCDDVLTPSGIKPQDTQIWRLVEAPIMDHLNTIVDHSNCPGDYVFWCIDEATSRIRISSVEHERKNSATKLMMGSSEASGLSTMSRIHLSDPECTCWTYFNYVPIDNGGDNIPNASPNFMIDSFDGDGKKDMGSCTSECWTSILDSFGVSHDSDSGSYTFGGKDLVKPFPNNTYKSYSVAPYVRKAFISSYNKTLQTAMSNTFGPPLGSVVKFVAVPVNYGVGGSEPDGYYTDEYLVIGKRISKDNTVPVGMLGNSTESGSTDIVTILTLVSNHLSGDASGIHYKEVIAVQKKFTEAYFNG